ncbi:MAG TPA: long-chain fatty acid--CoA ligase [Candidatus Dormibacteraeota bacterium]|jgi:long-subunit acyl-CoA synthetase (AMP-forming)|nr:long-chain fatty acid--CoA ligase [Candidatus Dormibacteraeota bacterium]
MSAVATEPETGATERIAVAPEGVTVEVRQASVCELFQDQIRARGDSPALHTKVGGAWRAITWKGYGEAVRRLAGYLLSEGLDRGERTAILSYNRAEWHIADLATLHCGAVTVGIYLTNSAPQCQYIVDHAEAPVVFVENADQLAKILQVRDQLPNLRRVVVFDGEAPAGDAGVLTWAQALERGDTYNAEHPGAFDDRWRAVRPEDHATYIYTSGTTGPPKAVILNHHNLLWTAESIFNYLELAPDDDLQISYLPLAHIAERVAGHVLHIKNGHRLYFTEDLAHLAANVAALRPTFMFGVPRIWEKFQAGVEKQLAAAGGLKGAIGRWGLKQGYRAAAAEERGERVDDFAHRQADRLVLSKIRHGLGFDRVKFLSTGAAPIAVATLRFFSAIGCRLNEVYGQSENTGPISTCRPGHYKIGTVGPAIPGGEIKIAEDGEVLYHGDNVFKGYFKDPAGTAEALDAGGWLHTGDVGELDEDGFLRITDRKKDLIITSGGKNISPSNIELELKRQPFVGQAVAIGERRPFMSALLTVDAERVADLAAAVGEPADMAVLTASDRVRALFQEGVDRVNGSLSNVERIKKFAILPDDLSIAGGELTPTLKVKRKVVNEKYAAVIESLYSGGGSAA